MVGTPEVIDAEGVRWRARVQAPGHTGRDYIRFLNPAGRLRLAGIPAGTWDQVTEEELRLKFLEAQLLPGRHRH